MAKLLLSLLVIFSLPLFANPDSSDDGPEYIRSIVTIDGVDFRYTYYFSNEWAATENEGAMMYANKYYQLDYRGMGPSEGRNIIAAIYKDAVQRCTEFGRIEMEKENQSRAEYYSKEYMLNLNMWRALEADDKYYGKGDLECRITVILRKKILR